MSFTIICENNEKERCVMGIIETLQAEIQALKERVERLESKWAQEEVEEAPRQLTRDDIIEMAKRDVAGLKRDARQNLLRARFVVNHAKRTVVCLLERFDLGYIQSRGIAKCHPDDCFNAAIGRAIALRRACGLEVPDEYLNAPQPTEVRVGDVVETFLTHGVPHETFKIQRIKRENGEIRLYDDDSNYYTPFEPELGDRIIDDSREEVAE
jgi:hypothetical protein